MLIMMSGITVVGSDYCRIPILKAALRCSFVAFSYRFAGGHPAIENPLCPTMSGLAKIEANKVCRFFSIQV